MRRGLVLLGVGMWHSPRHRSTPEDGRRPPRSTSSWSTWRTASSPARRARSKCGRATWPTDRDGACLQHVVNRVVARGHDQMPWLVATPAFGASHRTPRRPRLRWLPTGGSTRVCHWRIEAVVVRPSRGLVHGPPWLVLTSPMLIGNLGEFNRLLAWLPYLSISLTHQHCSVFRWSASASSLSPVICPGCGSGTPGSCLVTWCGRRNQRVHRGRPLSPVRAWKEIVAGG